MPKKPTGNQGYNRLNIDGEGNATGEYIRELLGTDKGEIERRIVEYFVEFWQSQTGSVIRWTQNPESDLDFTLELPGGAVKLELTELLVPDSKGNPYKAGNVIRTFGQYADALLKRIVEKAAKYPSDHLPKHLLIYPTHEPFDAPDQSIAIAQARLKAASPPTFECVFFLQMPPTGPLVRCLYPIPDGLLEGFNREDWETREVIIFDPAKMELKKG